MAKGRNQHVVPRDGGWAVKPEGGQRASSIHGTQREAIDRGREVPATSIRSSSSTDRTAASESKTAQKDEACATRGLDICAQALRKIVSPNKKFVPEDWELSGGQPQSPLNN